MDFSIQESAMLLKKNLMVESLLYVGAGAGENKPGAGQNPDRLSNTYPTYLNIWLELVRDHEGINQGSVSHDSPLAQQSEEPNININKYVVLFLSAAAERLQKE